MNAGFYGDTHFIMNQTSSTFRPRDARDAAANCGANNGDCNPQYTVQFACNLVLDVNAKLVDPNDPVFVAGVGGWAPPVGFANRNRKGWLHPILPFTA